MLLKIALAAWLLWAAGCLTATAGEAAAPRVTIALLPNGTPVSALKAVPGISPGLLSAGLGEVSPEQTYLDITQGNRVFDSLYDEELDPVPVPAHGTRVPAWARIVRRADSAPAEIVPGLLASSLGAGAMGAGSGLSTPALLAADRQGRLRRLGRGCRTRGCSPPVSVVEADPAQLPRMARRLGGRDLLIALERPPPTEHAQLAIGIAGAGFDGNLTSDSTRTEGYVSSTDLAPTILARFGLAVPSQMDGTAIHTEGRADFGEVTSLGSRLAEIPSRRAAVVGLSLLLWALAAALAAALRRGRTGLRLLALSVVYLPLLLMLGAALRPGEAAELLLLALGAPALGALTLTGLGGYRALAVACGLTTAACAVDVIAGSPLTSLSLIGPNPGGGVRFYGIGNELEAILAPLILVGTGAAIAGFAAESSRRAAAVAFLAVAFLAALVFAAGRFGADVGAAIVFPVGAVVSAAVVSGRRSIGLAGDRGAVPGARPACPDRPRLRWERPPDPVRPRRRRLRGSRRRRRAAPAALGDQLRPSRRVARLLGAARGARRRHRAAGPRPRLVRGFPGARRCLRGADRGDRGRHSRQRLGGASARGRHRLPAGIRRLRLGRAGGIRLPETNRGCGEAVTGAPVRGFLGSCPRLRCVGVVTIRHRNINYP